MEILLIEDDQFKQEEIELAIAATGKAARTQLARSVRQAVFQLRGSAFDRIILDMALPSHESRLGGAQPVSQPTGGIEILLELAYEGRSDPVVIVTQYPEIEFEGRLYPLTKARRVLADAIGAPILDVIYFEPQEPSWRTRLEKALG